MSKTTKLQLLCAAINLVAAAGCDDEMAYIEAEDSLIELAAELGHHVVDFDTIIKTCVAEKKIRDTFDNT